MDLSEDIISSVRKRHGEGKALALSDGGLSLHIPGIIPTGSPHLDWCMGRGGWPLSRICLLGGDEGTGKTTLCLQACRGVQEMGGIAVYIDAEYKLDVDYADALEVDVDKLVISQPEHLQEALAIIETVVDRVKDKRIKTGIRTPVLVIFDSISAIPPKEELEGAMDDIQVGAAARAMGKGLRKLVKKMSEEAVCLVLVSQLREKIGVQFGPSWVTSCGKAPLFYAAMVAHLGNSNKAVKEDDNNKDQRTGRLTNVTIIKNQVAPPHRKAQIKIDYGAGIDIVHGLHSAARKSQWCDVNGGWVVAPDGTTKWNGLNGLAKMSDSDRAAIVDQFRAWYGAMPVGRMREPMEAS